MKTTARKNSRRQRGASSVEYLLVLALVVIPLAIVANTIIFYPGTMAQPKIQEVNDGSATPNGHQTLIYSYFDRVSTMIRTPFG